MNKISAFAAETRAGILGTTIIPAAAGAAAAYYGHGAFAWGVFLAVLAGFIFLHLGTNVINDYFDAKDGTDNVNKNYISPFTGGSRLLQTGAMTPREVLAEGMVLFIVAAGFLCFAAAASAGPFILPVLVFAAASGIFYSAPPFKISHTGFGELLVFVNFGPVICCTSYYAQAHAFSATALLVSVPMGLMTASFVLIAGFPDYEADKKTGKKNLVVRLGRKKARYVYAGILVLSYMWVISAAACGIMPARGLAALAAAPASAFAAVSLWKNYNAPLKLAPACAMTLAAHLIAGAAIAAAFL